MRRYRFIESHCTAFSIDTLAHALGVSRSGFYAWRDRSPSAHQQRHGELVEQVRTPFAEHRAIYGSCKITAEFIRAKHSGVPKHRGQAHA